MSRQPPPIPKTAERTPGPLGKDTKSNNDKFLQDLYSNTNRFRKMHGCPELKVNAALSKHAQEWANHLRDKNIMQHRPKPKYGENIFLSGGMDVTGDLPVEMWYREINAFNFDKPDFTPTSGHFTQLIWKSCTEMGAGVARKADRTWVVCNYNPPGNVMGQFKENVPRKL
ncbi:Golgi-associated plant pathogenesis-related protein 1 [Drosophila sulfurigaster albostrigata]|uniref:Golgi-associated plant pathogenesis-related protein 1 n=1 Tax=Drosophila sulfurigaster albostrigata TaxID=89887 RepID=UPI002D21BFDC|nr:Golgi-associated plant pathogenesis-related protein 1 [Drosophila sulfurigaster albostrigata]